MAKARPIPENVRYQCYDQFINYIQEIIRQSECNTKQKVTRLFESKIDNNTPTDYRQKRLWMPVKTNIEYQSEKDKKPHQLKDTL